MWPIPVLLLFLLANCIPSATLSSGPCNAGRDMCQTFLRSHCTIFSPLLCVTKPWCPSLKWLLEIRWTSHHDVTKISVTNWESGWYYEHPVRSHRGKCSWYMQRGSRAIDEEEKWAQSSAVVSFTVGQAQDSMTPNQALKRSDTHIHCFNRQR